MGGPDAPGPEAPSRCAGPVQGAGLDAPGRGAEQHFHGRRTIRLWSEAGGDVDAIVDAIGHMPLPPYIHRPDDPRDRERYQTVYARTRGSVAAPTAGLHLTTASARQLGRGRRRARRGHAPRRLRHLQARSRRAASRSTGSIPEAFEVSDASGCRHQRRARRGAPRHRRRHDDDARAGDGGASGGGRVAAGRGTSELFIHPGHRFRVVRGLLTNFHLPKSSLLMLVCAFAGTRGGARRLSRSRRARLPVLQLWRRDADSLTGRGAGSESSELCALTDGEPEAASREPACLCRFAYEEFDLSGIRTYPLKSRPSKARAEDFARPYQAGSGVTGLLDSLPSMLAAGDFRAVVAAMCDGRAGGRGIVWGIGAHVIKTGLSPVLIDLMERGFVSALATNGAGIIHDFEIALSGATSEDVEASLGEGRVRHGRRDGPPAERRDQRRRGGRAGPRPGGRSVPVREAPAARALVGCGGRLPARDSADRSRGDRDRHHPHASGRVGRGARRGQSSRLPVLRVERRRASRKASTSTAGRP